MRELDFLPPWYLQLRRERRLLGRTVIITFLAVFTLLALQGGSWWMLHRQEDHLQRSRQDSARLASVLSRQQALMARRDLLLAEARAWTQAAAPVSAVALSHKLAELVPSRVALTQLKFEPAGTVHLSGVAGDDVDVAALLLSLNRERSFNQVVLGAVKDQHLASQSMRRFDVSFVASADGAEVLP